MDKETKETDITGRIPHVRLNKIILRCPFCQRGFSRRVDLDNHKICQNLSTDRNNNVKQRVGDTYYNVKQRVENTKRTNFTNNGLKQREIGRVNVNDVKQGGDETEKLARFTCPFCNESFTRWSVFCRHNSFHTFVSALKDCNNKLSSNEKNKKIKPNVLISEKESCKEKMTKKKKLLGKNRVASNEEMPSKENIAESVAKIKAQRKRVCRRNKYRKLLLKAKGCSSIKDRKINFQKTVHKCNVCHRRFGRSNALTVHLRVHTNYRPYKCRYCSKRFKQLCHVNNHERLHSGEEPWQCLLCGQKFRQKSNLDYHTNKKH